MADPGATVRQRKVPKEETQTDDGREAAQKVRDDDKYSPWLDVFRVVTFLLLASCGLSYLVSSGEALFWGMKTPPKYMQVGWWKSQLRGPLYLSPDELARFDGTDESRPIYLSINGTIYDVSANRRTYGPGGSYHFFAGCDASRAYVTGCFAEDRTLDMRGVEEMYLPLDDPAADASWDPAQLAEARVAERRDAERKAHDALRHWVDFFAKSPRYPHVGYLKLPDGWLESAPRRKLCDVAANGRTKRKPPPA